MAASESFSRQLPQDFVAAKRREDNVLLKLTRSRQMKDVGDVLRPYRDTIRKLVALHLGLKSADQCIVEHPSAWISGRFNTCVLLQVTDNQGDSTRKIFRCPLPKYASEEQCTSPSDEFARVAAGTQAWMTANCPEVPVPQLRGFGFLTGHHVSSMRDVPG